MPGAVDVRLVDDDLADVVAQVVAQRPDDDVGFLVDQERCRPLLGGLADLLPELEQVIQIPLQFLGGAAHAGGARDHAHPAGDGEVAHGFAQLGAVVPVDAPGHAAGAGVVGHQHQVAAGEADEGGQRGALVAALFLLDLDDQFLALGQHLLDVDAPLTRVLLEVGAGDLLERQETVPAGAVVDEGGLQAGFDAGDPPLVDVGFALLAGAYLNVQVT